MNFSLLLAVSVAIDQSVIVLGHWGRCLHQMQAENPGLKIWSETAIFHVSLHVRILLFLRCRRWPFVVVNAILCWCWNIRNVSSINYKPKIQVPNFGQKIIFFTYHVSVLHIEIFWIMVLKPSGPRLTVTFVQHVAHWEWCHLKANGLPLTLIYYISISSHEVEVKR